MRVDQKKGVTFAKKSLETEPKGDNMANENPGAERKINSTAIMLTVGIAILLIAAFLIIFGGGIVPATDPNKNVNISNGSQTR